MKNSIEFFTATFLLFFFVFQFSSDDTSENGSERSNNDSSDTYTTNFPNKATSLDDIASADKKALNATESFTLTATAKDPKATVKVVSVSELAKTTIETALAAQGVTSSVEVGMGTGVNGGFVVIQVTAQNGSVAYYVYTTANA